MVEVRKALSEDGDLVQMYPQIVPKEPNRTKYYSELRFYCKSCSREWLINTIPGEKKINAVPQDSQYIYREEDNVLILRKPITDD